MAISIKTLVGEIAAAEQTVIAADARASATGRALREQWQARVPTMVGGAGLLLVARQILKRKPRVRKERTRDVPLLRDNGDWLGLVKKYSPVVSIVPQVVTVVSALVAAYAAKDAKKGLTSAAEVDLDRFAGTWYEIARLPKVGAKDSGADSRITYARTDSGLRLLSLSRKADGSVRRVTGRAKLRDDATQSRFKVSFSSPVLDAVPFVWSDYTIVDVADDYSTAIVGTEDRKEVWLLAKRPTVDDATRESFLNKARAQGFDTTALVFTPHTGSPPSEAPFTRSTVAEPEAVRPV